MKKIIITVIATIVLIAPFKNARGQSHTQRSYTHYNPAVNVLIGVNAKISFGIWRFEPFFQVGGHWQMFEERMTSEMWNNFAEFHSEFRSPRFEGRSILDFGMALRITDRNRVKAGTVATVSRMGSIQHYYENGINKQYFNRGLNWTQYYLAYIHRINLSQRVYLNLNVQYGVGWTRWRLPLETFPYGTLFRYVGTPYHLFGFATQLNYAIFSYLKLNVQLGYTRRYDTRNSLPTVEGTRPPNANLLDFSVGVHLYVRRHQQTAPRTPRPQVSPRHRMLPCPPGQMRHGRSWDRPPSVFNHPTRR